MATKQQDTENITIDVPTNLMGGGGIDYVSSVTHVDHLGLSVPAALFRLKGLSPLLMSSPKSMFVVKPSGSRRNAVEATREEQAEMAAYRNDDGTLYLPSVALRAGLLRAATSYKVNKETAKNYLADISVLPEDNMLIQRDGAVLTEYDGIDSRRAVNRTTKGGIIVHRPIIFLPWEIIVTVAWYKGDQADNDKENNQMLHTLLQTGGRAGRQVGIGSFRPERTGWFGRYLLELV